MIACSTCLDTPDYTSIIDDRAFNRITNALQDAKERGATLVQLIPGKAWDKKTRKIAPHVVLNAPADCELRTREIFGPILPVIGYTNIEDTITIINNGPRPLALYPFSNKKKQVHHLITHVMSGGVTVNDGILHTAQHDMPFGGVGDRAPPRGVLHQGHGDEHVDDGRHRRQRVGQRGGRELRGQLEEHARRRADREDRVVVAQRRQDPVVERLRVRLGRGRIKSKGP